MAYWNEILIYTQSIGTLEFLGLIFGLINVILLIRQNIMTWPAGLVYIFISFIIFWQYQLYGDFILHILFLVLNIYGWWNWKNGRKEELELIVSKLDTKEHGILIVITVFGIFLFGYLLSNINLIWTGIEAASVPYWDATTSILSVTGIWLMAKKKIENWYYWLVVDILASGIYFYKGIYFYSFLYGIYILLAVIGYLAWKKSYDKIE
ncbi:MAG: nicotinamide mononucleotide transporter [Reichenbachiella sp.]